VALYAALSLLLLVVGERIPQSQLRGLGAMLFAPFDRVVLAGDRAVAAWSENRRLHQRVAELELEASRLRAARVENDRLRELLGFARESAERLVPAEVIAVSGEPVPTGVTLDVGENRGVSANDAVITGEGLLGRLSEVYLTSSRALLLTDPNTAVACEVESTGVQGVLRFTYAPRPRLVLTVEPYADSVRLGQRVLTSGLSRRVPRGIPVGLVKSVTRDASGFALEIEVTPAARLSRLRHAFILPRERSREIP
jgi:rod shape-determining protein MreC